MNNKSEKLLLDSLYDDCLMLEMTDIMNKLSYDFRKDVHFDMWHRIALIDERNLCTTDKCKLIRIINFVDSFIFLPNKENER